MNFILKFQFTLVLLFFLTKTKCVKERFNDSDWIVDKKLASTSLSQFVNTKQNPCDNFYQFACGNRLKNIKSGKIENTSEIYYKNEYDFDHFKKETLRGDYDSISEALSKINTMVEICQRYIDNDLKKCMQKVEDFGYYGYTAFFIQQLENNLELKNTYDIIQKIFDGSVNEIIQLIDKKNNFFNTEEKRSLLNRLKPVKLYRGYYQRLKNLQLVEKCYGFFKVSFNQSVETMIKNIENYKFFVPEDVDERETCINYIANKRNGDVKLEYMLKYNAFYHYNKNRFIINPRILKRPCFDNRFPSSLQYGCIGYVIGRELVNRINNHLNSYLYKERINKEGMKEYLDTYDKSSECYQMQYDYKNATKTIKKQMLNEIIGDNSGLEIAHKVFMKYLKDSKIKEPKIPGFEKYSNEQLFFISYAITFCEDSNFSLNPKNVYSNKKFSKSVRVFKALGNYKPFSKAFNCKSESKMNPKNKCTFW